MDTVINNDSVTIERHGRNALVMEGQSAFTFEVASALDPRDSNNFKPQRDSLDWTNNHYNVGGWRILPYGDNNDLPREIQVAVQNNSYAPGMLEKLGNILWGKGPYFFTEHADGDNIVRKVVDDPELKAWLRTWDYQEYLLNCVEDYVHMQGYFTKFFRNKGARIGRKPMIAKLQHVGIECARLASEFELNSPIPTHVVETDFSFNTIDSILDFKVYPLYVPDEPFKAATAMLYASKRSFGSNTYPVPKLFGSLPWIRRSTAIPLILEALSKNAINVKYHIVSPQEFWDQQEKRIQSNCEKRGITYEDSMLEEYKIKLLKGIAKVLSDEANTGKFWHTTKTFTVMEMNLVEHGWEIHAIDQNIKDFVESQIMVSDHSIKNLGANIGLHSANAGVSENGKSDSGSEQLYALENHKKTSNPVQEMMVTKAFNMALEANFPGKGYKVGFLQEMAVRQQDLSEKDRQINKK